MQTSKRVKVWDPLVRIFHWSLVAAFAVAFVTEDDWMRLHALAGYVVTSLLVFRVMWGFVGTRHARFTDFVRRPRVVLEYLRSLIRSGARRYLGHNPAGGAMIVVLLLMLTLTALSGMVVYAIGDKAGPLAGWFLGTPVWWEKIFGELHEGLANTTLFMVFVHVGGVLIESLRHRENLVRSMWTGFKRV